MINKLDNGSDNIHWINKASRITCFDNHFKCKKCSVILLPSFVYVASILFFPVCILWTIDVKQENDFHLVNGFVMC